MCANGVSRYCSQYKFQSMTENEYILSKLTWFDKLCGHSIWPPVVLIFAMIISVAYETPFVPVQRTLLICFLVTFFLAIVLRQRLIKRVDQLKNEFQKL